MIGTLDVVAVLERTRGGVLTFLIAASLLLTALPASAGHYASRGDLGWDFLDPTNITWERVRPRNITWESITWE